MLDLRGIYETKSVGQENCSEVSPSEGYAVNILVYVRMYVCRDPGRAHLASFFANFVFKGHSIPFQSMEPVP